MRSILILSIFFRIAAYAADSPTPITWGAETNGLRAGISVWPPALPVVFISNACTHPFRLARPVEQEMFSIELTEVSGGKSVLSRRAVSIWGKPIARKETFRSRRGEFFASIPEATQLGSVTLTQDLKMKEKTAYRLKVQVKLLNLDPKEKYLQPVVLPPVEIEFIYKAPKD